MENMSFEEMIVAIEHLACSQGFYARLLRDIEYLDENNPVEFDRLVTELEAQNFSDVLEMIEYFEG